MEKGVFRFKKFSCRHFSSSMRIGVDGVLIGAWADVSGSRILDVGTGCGVIALMCAQRNPLATVDAIDVHKASVEEAACNFRNSPWCERLMAREMSFADYYPERPYDLIVSNPPYFNSGVNPEESARMRARHDGELSPTSLLERGRDLVSERGRISMVVPYIRADEIVEYGAKCGMAIGRRVDIRGNAGAPLKRSLLEFVVDTEGIKKDITISFMTLEETPGNPTPEYRALCKDFYLYF